MWAETRELSGRRVKFMKITTFSFICPMSLTPHCSRPEKRSFTWAVGTITLDWMWWSNNFSRESKSTFISITNTLTFSICFKTCSEFTIEILKFFWKSSIRCTNRAFSMIVSTRIKRRKPQNSVESTSLMLFSKGDSTIMWGPFIEYCLLW